MSRHRYLVGLLPALIVWIFPISAYAGGRASSAYGGSLDFASQLLRLDDGCLSVDGTITAGSFFENLRRLDSDGRIEYRKHGRVVTEYPESLSTSIRIVGDKCAASSSNSPSSIFGDNSYSLKFGVEWKSGMHLRPAMLSPVAAHCVGSSSVVLPNRDITIPSVTCQLTVNSSGVPLADHLIVSIFAPDGTRLTRLSAAP